MVVTPDSKIRLLKCPLKLDNNNQITWASVNAQTAYFQSLPYIEDTGLTYIRKDGVIRVDTSGTTDYEDLLSYNYVMYQNTHYDTKWFYAYITDIKYLNDGCTEISIETDVFQTWFFEGDWKASFIEREHVNNDTIGNNTVPENIELGEYIVNSFVKNTDLDTTNYIILSTTDGDGNTAVWSTGIGDIPFKGYVYILPDVANLKGYLQYFQQHNHIQNVYAVYSIPSFCVANATYDTTDVRQALDVPANEKEISISKPSTIDGYTPKNNKLFTFPYRYLLVSNNNGQSNILKYERFGKASECEFDLVGLATVGGEIKLIPIYYDKLAYNEQESLVAGKWPTLSWSQDLYTNWVSQNAVNIGMGVGTSVLSIVGGVASMATGAGAVAGAGLIGAGIAGIGGSLAQHYQHQFDPVSFKGNVNAGSINVDNARNGFFFYNMSIKQEYAKIIDEYFNAYGYKVNRYGIPHLHVRTYWDYCKTINCNFTGNIPNNDLKKFRELFDNGCTFWHDTTKFLDYSQNNTIIT